ncbi:LD-carboxypeptidase [Nitrospira defluvii]|nr:LD-carboxypeptidase [Nitrospira defluvii]
MNNPKNKNGSLLKPKALKPGGTVGVVAPAGRVDSKLLHKGVSRLETLGLKVILGKHIEKTSRFFAGTDPERADDLQAMFLNKEVDAVLCARGGVGAARIIPFLDRKALVAQSQKIFVGLSDITSLLLYINKVLGWVCFHGPMVATQFGRERPPCLEDHFLRVLSGETLEMRYEGMKTIRPDMAEGVLTGGCLTLICTTIGTPYEIDTNNKILFIEDISEAPFRVDRMLSYLKTLGKFKDIRGLIFGQMPQCSPDDLPEIILDIVGDSRIPILFGFPSGHGDGIATLPFGIGIRLDAASGTLTLLEPAVN